MKLDPETLAAIEKVIDFIEDLDMVPAAIMPAHDWLFAYRETALRART
jgi:hypothetical protein